MPICALPEHLKDHGSTPIGDGTDHDNSVQRAWKRAWTAFGPRCPQGLTFLRQAIPWTNFSIPYFPVLKKWREFPKVLLAYNVPRWMGLEDKSVLFIPQFVGRLIGFWTPTEPWTATEMQQGNEWYQRGHVTSLRPYGPSPIQKLAYGWSWQLTWPLHFAISYRRRREGKDDFVFFFRFGARWDSGDNYFVCLAVFCGFSWN